MSERKAKLNSITGIDRSFKAAPNSSYIIKNMSYSPRLKAWFKDRGIMGYFHPSPNKQTEDVYSLGLFAQRANAKTYILAEREQTSGELLLEYIAPRETSGQVTLQTGRHKPTTEDVGTIYVQFGIMTLIINGIDTPLKYFGGTRIEEFGFSKKPDAPQPFQPSRGNMRASLGGTNDYLYAQSLAGDDITVAFPKNNHIGLGSTLPFEESAYAYKVSFITDTGSESPLSNASVVVSWQNGYQQDTEDPDVVLQDNFRYGIVVDKIPTGPAGTVKRRLYRTKNMKYGADDNIETYYYLTDIPNNYETCYNDYIPDSKLSSQAPNELDSGLFPLGAKYAASFNGRIFVGGGTHYPTAIMYSNALQPETFPTANYLDGSSRDGGDVTGLYAHEGMLFVFRNKAIELVIATDDPIEPFKIVTLTNTIGTVATKTICSIPNLGLIFLSNDGFYIITGNYLGGGKIQISKISEGLADLIDKINITALARAVATYNQNDDEYWCSVPTDGYSFPTYSFIFHPQAPGFSTRERIPANCFVQLPEGYTMFGTNANIANVDIATAGGTVPVGIPISFNVWCGISSIGYSASSESGLSRNTLPATVSTAWLDFGDAEAEKNIKYVIIHTISTGYTLGEAPTLSVYTDNINTSVQENRNIINTQIQDRPWQPSYAVALGSSTSIFSRNRISSLRYSVETSSSRYYRFEFQDNVRAFKMHVLGFSVVYEMNGVEHAWSSSHDWLNTEEILTGITNTLKDEQTNTTEIVPTPTTTIIW